METRTNQFASQEQRKALLALARSVAKQGCRFLEVGSWMEDSTVVLARAAKENGGHLLCVDWWKGNIGTELVDIATKEDA